MSTERNTYPGTLAGDVAARFAEALVGAHEAPPDAWEQRHTRAALVERLDPPCDPARARFWDLLQVEPAVHNLGRDSWESHSGYRQLDLRPTEAQAEALRARGFVVLDDPARRGNVGSFGGAFHLLYSDDLPVYVAPDPLLHAWHRSFDAALKKLERDDLARLLDDVLSAMLEAARCRVRPGSLVSAANDACPADPSACPAEVANSVPCPAEAAVGPLDPSAYSTLHPTARDALRDAVVYCWVARCLLRGELDSMQPRPGADPMRWAGTAARQEADSLLRAVMAGRAATVRLMGRDDVAVDFSLFRPRGHYAGDRLLERYFRAVMWCGHVGVPLCGRDATPRTAAAAMTLVALLRESGAWGRWAAMDGALRDLMGTADCVDAAALRSFAERHPDLADVLARQPHRTEALTEALARDAALLAETINADLRDADDEGDAGRPAPSKTFALLGRRFVLDSWALSQTVFDAVDRADGGGKVPRGMPTGLDAAYAVLDSHAAVPALADGARASGHRYLHQLDALRAAVHALPASRWEESVYMRWLGLLRALSCPAPEGAPRHTRTAAWAARDLEAQMASWAQLRHDTVLYAKQGATMCLQCEYPAGWVDARPAFWESFAGMADAAADVARRVSLAVRAPDGDGDGDSDAGAAVHSRVMCDGCRATPIRGRRMRCAMCVDFDLCEACVAAGRFGTGDRQGQGHAATHVLY